MVGTSRRLTWKSGSKKSPNALIRNHSIIGGTRVSHTTRLTTLAMRAKAIAGRVCAPNHSDPVCLSVLVGDGWSASRELSAPPGHFSSAQSPPQSFPGANAPGPMDTPVDVESLNAPAPSTPGVLEFIHSVQFGIMPKRLSLPHPDDAILCGYEEDVLSIQDTYTAWVMNDPEAVLDRLFVSKGNSVPDRSWNPGPRRGT